MRGAAGLAEQYAAPIQTHLAENLAEIERVRQLYPAARDYTDVYDRCGLLTERSVLGHCIYLSERELKTLAHHGCKVAHCPTANFYLASGLLPLKRVRDAGITVGLGTDVGAGPELNLWQVMRAAIDTQRARTYADPSNPPLRPAEAFHLATQGGADTLNRGQTLGSLDPGKEADLLVLDPAAVVPYGDTTASSNRRNWSRSAFTGAARRPRWRPSCAAMDRTTTERRRMTEEKFQENSRRLPLQNL